MTLKISILKTVLRGPSEAIFLPLPSFFLEKIDEKGASAKKRKRTDKKSEHCSEKQKKSEVFENITEEKVSEKPKNPPEGISKNAQMVYNVMSEGESELDFITRKSGLGIGVVLAAISELEIFGVITKTSPNTYEII